MNPAQLLQYPDINGAKTSFCSVEIKMAGGLVLPGVKSLSYKDPLEFSTVYGTSPRPQGRTRGRTNPTGSLEVYRDQWDALLEVLTGGGAWGFSEHSWPITVQYAETSAPLLTKTDLLAGTRIHSPEFSGSEGVEALTVKLELSIMEIVWHGTGAPKNQLTSLWTVMSTMGTT